MMPLEMESRRENTGTLQHIATALLRYLQGSSTRVKTHIVCKPDTKWYSLSSGEPWTWRQQNLPRLADVGKRFQQVSPAPCLSYHCTSGG